MKNHKSVWLGVGIMLALVTPAATGRAQEIWTTNSPMLRGVVEAQGVTYGGKFYVIGGADGSIAPPQVYDPALDAWSSKTADPTGRSASAVGVIGNKIYVAEGWINADGNNATTTLEAYDPVMDTWTPEAASSQARGESASAVIGGKLYITGGNAGFSQSDNTALEIYDANANTWSNGAPIPVAPEGAVGAAINGKFYVVGGYVRGQGLSTSVLYIYDPATDAWTTGASMPSPRNSAVGGVINGELFITGGAANGLVNNPVYIYNPAIDTWSTGAAEPLPRNLGVGAVVNGTLFVAGGYSNTNGPGTQTTALEAYTPSTGVSIKLYAGVIINGPLGSNYLIQATADSASGNWTTLTNVALPAQPYIYIDYSTPLNPRQFYRAVAQ